MRNIALITWITMVFLWPAVGVSAQTVVEQAQQLTEAREFDAAIELLKNHLDAHKDDAEVWRELGNTYLAAARWNDAIRAQEKAVE